MVVVAIVVIGVVVVEVMTVCDDVCVDDATSVCGGAVDVVGGDEENDKSEGDVEGDVEGEDDGRSAPPHNE